MNNTPIAHIVDDDAAVRQALSLLMEVENIPSLAYASAEDYLNSDACSQPGCLVLDIRMPGMNGLQLLQELKRRNINTPVIFITGHGDVSMAVQAMKDGALDFIEKPFNNQYLLDRVSYCLSECINIQESASSVRSLKSRLEKLTKREKEVMDLMVEGKQNKVIARDLGISSRTVEIHRSKVMHKLDAHSLSDVVRIALTLQNS